MLDEDGYVRRTSWSGKEGETAVHDACHELDPDRLTLLMAQRHDPWALTDSGTPPVGVLHRYWAATTTTLRDRLLQCVDVLFVDDSGRLRPAGPARVDIILRQCSWVFRQAPHMDDAFGARIRLYVSALGLAGAAHARSSF